MTIEQIVSAIKAGECPEIDFERTYAMRDYMKQRALLSHDNQIINTVLFGKSYIVNHGGGCRTKNTFVSGSISVKMEDL